MTIKAGFNHLSLSHSWVTVGSFDGIHLGHQALARKLVDGAHRSQSQAVVISFYPHPSVFFGRAAQAYTLTSPEERKTLLKNLGVDHVITLKFNEELANLTALNFMSLLKEQLGIDFLLIGFNFALGRGRTGDMDTLQQIGKMLEYKVEVVPPFKVNNVVVSSSQIRSLLQEGRLARANHLLNHPYSLSGKVIHGEHRGHGLGFPTANLQIPADRLIPAKGVYATRAIVHDKVYTSVTNIGVRPTFENPLEFPRVEPHILDLEEDLYGQEVKLELVDYLRPEIAFNNSTELIAQVQLDIQKAREVIENGQ